MSRRESDHFNPRDVVSAREIADRVSTLTVERIHHLRAGRRAFPQPIGRRGHEYVWYWPDVKKWARSYSGA